MVALASIHASADSGHWEVFYDESDLTNAASPLPMGNCVLVNVAGIGPMLGLTVMPEASGFAIESPDGKTWHWETGSATLSSDSRMISLSVPGLQEGTALLLDSQAISELCGIPASIDVSARQVVFRRRDVATVSQASQADLPDGWAPFTIAKPKSATPSIQHAGLSPESAILNLPPSKDRLNIGLGLGIVQGADCGMEVTGSGRLAGGNLSLSALLTKGDLGARLRNSHVMWLDSEGGKGIEAGDMYSETWGLAQGVRYTWKAGGNRWPSLGINLASARTDNPHASVSYRDELKLGSALSIRGEIGTDKSSYVNVRYSRFPFQIFAFKRSLPDDFGNSEGIFGSLSLSKSVSLFYGVNSSTDRWDKNRSYRSAGLRIPILKRCSLVLGQTQYDGGGTTTTSRSAGLTVPVSNVMHLYLRYQRSSWDMNTFSGALLDLHNTTDTLLTSLSLFASRRVHLDYQRNMVTQQGQTAYNEQLITNYALSPNTSLQAITGFPNLGDSNVMRLRLERRLTTDTSLTVDYGRLSPYQSKNDVFGKRGFMVMVRKTWPIPVPARGGEVSGIIHDHLGQPIGNAVVQLGTYTALSDKSGKYSFRSVPTGAYKISLPADSIPADYKASVETRDLEVKRDSRQTVDFSLVPLGCITGRVYMDTNGNGKYDDGEGVSDIAVFANDQATATDKAGRFSFYNLDPGQYAVRIAAELFAKRYTVKSQALIELDLKPDQGIGDIEFELDQWKRPIRMIPL